MNFPYQYIMTENPCQPLCKYHPFCKYVSSKCKYRHFMFEGEKLRKDCKYGIYCIDRSCSREHKIKEFCAYDLTCGDPRTCGKRHTKMMKSCAHQFNLPDNLSYEDICPYGKKCTRGDSCRYLIHDSYQEMFDKNWVIVDGSESPCGGWYGEYPCTYWHIGDSKRIK